MILNSKLYDALKWVALVVLPALAVLYLGLGTLWEWERTKEVVGTIALIDTFLGAILQLSSHNFKNDPRNLDGYLDSSGADPDTGIPDLKLVVTRNPDELLNKNVVMLKVGAPPVVPVRRDSPPGPDVS